MQGEYQQEPGRYTPEFPLRFPSRGVPKSVPAANSLQLTPAKIGGFWTGRHSEVSALRLQQELEGLQSV